MSAAPSAMNLSASLGSLNRPTAMTGRSVTSFIFWARPTFQPGSNSGGALVMPPGLPWVPTEAWKTSTPASTRSGMMVCVSSDCISAADVFLDREPQQHREIGPDVLSDFPDHFDHEPGPALEVSTVFIGALVADGR